jgi:hypothetical protein
MSQTLILELSDEIFSAIHHQAEKIGISPANLVTDSLEKQFSIFGVLQNFKSEAQKNSARQRFESHFGVVNLGYPTGADNESIDADIAKEYAR